MFLHANSTLYKALQLQYITNIPGVTATAFKKYAPFSPATIKGHLDQTRQNIRSTKKNSESTETNDKLFPITHREQRKHKILLHNDLPTIRKSIFRSNRKF